MRKADFQARIKKIEIANKVLADSWSQTIRVQLDEIGLTNENLLELRQFRPNEQVKVVIEPVQLTLFDMMPEQDRKEAQAKAATNKELNIDDAEEEYLSFSEDEDEPVQGKIVREFKI